MQPGPDGGTVGSMSGVFTGATITLRATLVSLNEPIHPDVDRWIASLNLPRHERLLRALLAHAVSEERIRFVELCCSVARGAGDELSDLDLGVGINDEAWPDALDGIGPALRAMGEPVDVLEHEMAAWAGAPHRRWFVQFADGTQLDLVAMPASRREGLPPNSVALYDPDGRLAKPMSPRLERATPDEVREWAFETCVALLNMDKYLRRGSLWEALEQLHAGRAHVWRLWAVVQAIGYPSFGLTSVLDEPDGGPPSSLERTVATLDADALRAAGSVLLDVLREVGPRACDAVGAAYPKPLETFVQRTWHTGDR